MADFSLPTTTTTYSDYPGHVRAGRESVAKMFNGTTDTNVPTGAIGWDATNRRWKEYSGTAWGELLPMATAAQAYNIRAAVANSADSVDGGDVECGTNPVAVAALANNALSLGGTAAAQFVQTTDSRLSNSRQCNNSFDSASTARTNLSVYSQAEVNAALTYKADVASPTFTGSPAAPTPTTSDSSTRIATTALTDAKIDVAKGEIAGSWVTPTLQNDWTATTFKYRLTDYGTSVQIQIHTLSGVSATGTTIITLPSGYRPSSTVVCVVSSGVLSISTGGVVTAPTGASAIHSGTITIPIG